MLSSVERHVDNSVDVCLDSDVKRHVDDSVHDNVENNVDKIVTDGASLNVADGASMALDIDEMVCFVTRIAKLLSKCCFIRASIQLFSFHSSKTANDSAIARQLQMNDAKELSVAHDASTAGDEGALFSCRCFVNFLSLFIATAFC